MHIRSLGVHLKLIFALSGCVVLVAVFITFVLRKNPTAPVPIEVPVNSEAQYVQPQPPALAHAIDDKLFVSLYGTPGYKGLGSLGEQPLADTVTRVQTLAAAYQPFSDRTVMPTFEIIVTVASAGPTENNDYSEEIDPATFIPWIEEAQRQGIYVVIDLQPGRTRFDQQIVQYESLLKYPHVGVALDPEWRLQTEKDRHLKTVGSVTAEEVQATAEWLAKFIRTNALPQKVFIIHQFKPSMIQQRETLQAKYAELYFIVHMDGHGTLGQKKDTWNRLLPELPTGIQMGWKNFYDEDLPTPTPQETMQQSPAPVFISYQ